MSRELLPLIRVDSKLRAREAAERIRARTEIPPDAVRRAEGIVLGVRERGDAALLS